MKKGQFEIVDRYSALGISRPNLETICLGQCEGTGYIPETDVNNPLWQEAHAKPHKEECDGFHFIKCLDCNGTGKKNFI